MFFLPASLLSEEEKMRKKIPAPKSKSKAKSQGSSSSLEGNGTENFFMSLRHCFALTREGAKRANGDASVLLEMSRGRVPGLICLNCGLSLHEILRLGRIGPWPVTCQPTAMRQLSRRRISAQGGDIDCDRDDVLYTLPRLAELVTSGAGPFVDFGALTREVFSDMRGVPVLLKELELGLMALPPGFQP